jgi:hypothetical protein
MTISNTAFYARTLTTSRLLLRKSSAVWRRSLDALAEWAMRQAVRQGSEPAPKESEQGPTA